MKTRRLKAAVAVTAAGVLALSACTSGGGETPTTPAGGTTAAEETTTAAEETTTEAETTEETEAPTTEETTEAAPAAEAPPTDTSDNPACLQDIGVTATEEGEIFFSTGEQEYSGYNTITADTYSTYNSVISGQMTSGFMYFGTDGTICRNTDFGTFDLVSGLGGDDEPMVVEYTISDDAVWSDGTPITINDYLLDWAAQNPEFVMEGEENPVFNHVSSSGPVYIPEGPQGEVGGKTFTVEYSEKYPDWQLMIGGTLPAHVLAESAGLTSDELAQAVLDRDAETVKSVAGFWNGEGGWLSEPGQLPDPAIAPSSGPYQLMPNGWVAGQSITLEPNPAWWGTPPATSKLTFRFLDAGQHVQALANQELHVIDPQATVDTILQLEAQGDAVTILQGSTLTWEHLDFNFRGEWVNEDPITEAEAADPTVQEETEAETVPAALFSDEAGGLAAREAFALCVPRQAIVDTLIAPLSPDTTLMNAREVFPFQDTYDEVVSAAYDGRYDVVDLDAARAKFEEAGLEDGVTLRLGYNGPNPRRQSTVELIKASCDQVGFNVEDVSNNQFFTRTLPNGAYDVALFAWAGSGQIASGQNIYANDESGRPNPQNYGEYSNPEVDAAFRTLASSLDSSVHTEQIKIIEQHLWDDLFGLPIYAHPGVAAHDSNLENVIDTAGQDGVSWNASQWAFAE
ncbi:MAG: ABC transporter family substrate-binding protein [bacterium]|nr:ABC transporter family substrate-binding protein [bacterium]